MSDSFPCAQTMIEFYTMIKKDVLLTAPDFFSFGAA